MILPFMLVAASLAGLLLLLRAARGGGVSVNQFDDLAGRTRPVDLDAFRNLVDPQEEEFLRECLSRREFRLVQKERLQAATEYVAKTAYNAAVLLRLGEAAMRNPDPKVAAAGRRLVETSVRLRIYALLCAAKLRVRIALPGVPLSVGRLVDSYQRLSGIATQLAVAQRPRYVSRLSAIL
jgi:hypothetical protein